MTEPESAAITVLVTDPETGATLDEVTIENDYLLIACGNRYVDGTQTYANGTSVVTIKVRQP